MALGMGMASWHKHLLKVFIGWSGLLDVEDIDLSNLDFSVGRRTVLELKDVGLNIAKISKLAQLPPSLRVGTAKILSLRLTIPGEFWFSSNIVVEVDGIQIRAVLDEQDEERSGKRKSSPESPVNVRSPLHRKVHRRLHSPSAYDSGGIPLSDDEAHIPTAPELAKSFLREQSVYDRRELEASMAADQDIDESILSESSDGQIGTGTAMGITGWFTRRVEDVVDRAQIHIKNVVLNLETALHADGQDAVPLALRFKMGAADFETLTTAHENVAHAGKRHLEVSNISLEVLSDSALFSELSSIPSQSPVHSRTAGPSVPPSERTSASFDSQPEPRVAGSAFSSASKQRAQMRAQPTLPEETLSSQVTDPTINAADAANDEILPPEASDYDIRPGDDNISWGSRRSKSSVPKEDFWKSIDSDDELPESLMLEKPAYSARRLSPAGFRQRRSVSPYDRGLHSPTSWPRPEESQELRPIHKGPGSWPAMEQSQQSIYQTIIPDHTSKQDSHTDNKQHALEAMSSEIHPPSLASKSAEPYSEDLTQSRMFDHDQAESIYLSAIAETDVPRMTHPGGWDSSSSPSQTSLLILQQRAHAPPDDSDANLATASDSVADDESTSNPYELTSGNATPRPASPVPPEAPHNKHCPNITAKRLFFVDAVNVWLPKSFSGNEESAQISPQPSGKAHPSSALGNTSMPGTFSAYSDLAASRRRGFASTYEDTQSSFWTPPAKQDSRSVAEVLSAEISLISIGADIPACRVLHKFALRATSAFRGPKPKTKEKVEAKTSKPLTLSLSIKQVRLSFQERLRQNQDSDSPPDLLLVVCDKTTFSSEVGEKSLQIADLCAMLNGHSLLFFDRESNMRSSTILTENTPAFSLTMQESLQVNTRPVTRFDIKTLPVALTIDLQIIDEVLGTFGGLSGVLELGNSILSEGPEASSPLPVNRASKGVRFQDEQPAGAGAELKIDCRVGGADVVLRGESCSVRLRTTSIKTAYREAGIGTLIDHIILTGPHDNNGGTAPASFSTDASSLRLDYLPAPQDRDLEVFLNLLTPSKDKYDNDDDILIDTLIRQRRKGALLRTVAGDIKVKLADFNCLESLTALGTDVSKLSAMTKYLPEDERPGPLTMLAINNFEAQGPINEDFGFLRIRLQNFQMAHVGLPALLALAVGTIQASPVGQADIVHPLTQLTGAENLPMIMGRMLGNEIEPKVKIKLFNICAEYSVPVILALTGIDKDTDSKELLAEVATSVMNLARLEPHNRRDFSPKSEIEPVTKRTRVILLVHDSAIGLTPAKLPSKALFVLTDAQASTLVPPEKTLTAELELKRAAIYITDQVDQEKEEIKRGALNNTAVNPRLATFLSKQGYASVGSIGKALISARVFQDPDEISKSVEVEFSNDFLLLETCADSTQTLIATLSGLAPPAAPSKQPKYKTEPGMTIEQMMSSFTGEPVVKPETRPETLFDVEEEPMDDPESLLLEPTLEADDFMAQSEMSSSLYGPISSTLGEDAESGYLASDAKEEDFADTAESLLEDDPFEMTDSPMNMPMADAALLRDLKKQCKKPVSDMTVDLGLYEIDDLGYNALGVAGQPLGSRDRYNTPLTGKRQLALHHEKQRFPFRLRLRDVNAIWNIYDGFDWQRTRDKITYAVEQVETRAEERKTRHRQSRDVREEDEPVIGDLLFNSFYIGVPSGNDAQELRRQINRGIDDQVSETELSAVSRPTVYSASGRAVRQRTQRRLKLERSRHHKIGFELKGVSADILVFPPDSKDIVSSVDVRIKDFEIFDQVPTSTWSKFLTHMQSNPSLREMAKPMFHIELVNVRTLEQHSAAELVLHVAVSPLRLHVDQDALDFIMRFFEFKDDTMADSGTAGEQPFLQRVEVETVDIRLDYKPKHIDYSGLRSGRTSEFMNFITLDAANIQLRHAIIYGLRGFDPLHKTLNDIWMPDVTSNQLPTVLAGLAPVRSLVNIGVSAKEVIAIPIREYKKDGRVVRSIQKGAYHFGKTTTSELARFGAKVAIGTQNVLQGAEEYLSPTVASSSSSRPGLGRSPSSDQGGWHNVGAPGDEEHEPRAISSYANQPLGALPGLAAARRYLEYDLLTARDALIAVQGEILESSTPGGVAAAVARHAPVVMLRPLIGATRAVGTTLLGVGNQIDRDNVRRMTDKYKSR